MHIIAVNDIICLLPPNCHRETLRSYCTHMLLYCCVCSLIVEISTEASGDIEEQAGMEQIWVWRGGIGGQAEESERDGPSSGITS